jgi:hypothetical protein
MRRSSPWPVECSLLSLHIFVMSTPTTTKCSRLVLGCRLDRALNTSLLPNSKSGEMRLVKRVMKSRTRSERSLFWMMTTKIPAVRIRCQHQMNVNNLWKSFPVARLREIFSPRGMLIIRTWTFMLPEGYQGGQLLSNHTILHILLRCQDRHNDSQYRNRILGMRGILFLCPIDARHLETNLP